MAPDDTSKKRHQEELKEQLRLVNPGLLMTSKQPIELDVQRGEQFVAKSAFTKVANPVIRIDNPITVSPNTSPAVSPDLSYQGSMSPPSRPRTPPQYYGDVLPYSGLAMAAAYPFPAAPFTGPAANVTAALLPPSLAALTLPAQNICAKCNISFRMTSDLVYHMRSQHKSDHAMTDTRRRRDQDKLRCPVCNESFRERHHLTRHMTAHQDKDGDKVDDDEELTARRRITK
ncbi:hypothetical protein O3M35_011792 [Rhynocoris fuscipes]|uniref:C2H2-type domain-containing protein n=1 Tax=Rhynocoris fuscipes TaxID=488301 RepID=A0AAW1CX01_9HEMI